MPARRRAVQKPIAHAMSKEFHVEYGGPNGRIRHSFVGFSGARNRALKEIDEQIYLANKFKQAKPLDSADGGLGVGPATSRAVREYGADALGKMRAEVADCEEPKYGAPPRRWDCIVDDYTETRFCVLFWRGLK